VSGLLTVTETAAFHIDWSSFLDDAAHQDPEVAAARGHEAVPLPLGLPSAVPLPEAARLLGGHAVRRVWRAEGRLEAGQQVETTVTTGPSSVRARYVAPGFKGEELLETIDPAALDEDGAAAGIELFRTSMAVGRTRIRAFAWGLNDLLPEQDPARFERWGEEPGHVRVLAAAVLLPTVLSLHVLGRKRRLADEPLLVETLARVAPAPGAMRFAVQEAGTGRAVVLADGAIVARVRLESRQISVPELVAAGSTTR
jgi:hypothetical protein